MDDSIDREASTPFLRLTGKHLRATNRDFARAIEEHANWADEASQSVARFRQKRAEMFRMIVTPAFPRSRDLTSRFVPELDELEGGPLQAEFARDCRIGVARNGAAIVVPTFSILPHALAVAEAWRLPIDHVVVGLPIAAGGRASPLMAPGDCIVSRGSFGMEWSAGQGVTCAHVVGATGNAVFQCGGLQLGTVAMRNAPTSPGVNRVDVAAISMTCKCSNTVPEGTLSATRLLELTTPDREGDEGTDVPVVDVLVRKVGQQTGHRVGVIMTVWDQLPIWYPDGSKHEMENVFQVGPATQGGPSFAEQGDSGSMAYVANDAGVLGQVGSPHLVGQVFAANDGARMGFFLPISATAAVL
ncbi:MAG: hypothetical protein QM817_39040 [Archangium sp.]